MLLQAIDPAAYSTYFTEFSEAIDSYVATGDTSYTDDDIAAFASLSAPYAPTAPAAAGGEVEVSSPYKPRKRPAAEDAEHTTPIRGRVRRNIMSPFGVGGGPPGMLFPSPSPNSKILFRQMEDCMYGASTPLADKIVAMRTDPSARLEWSFIEPWTIGRVMQDETKESLVFDVDATFNADPRIIVVKLTDVQV